MSNHKSEEKHSEYRPKQAAQDLSMPVFIWIVWIVAKSGLYWTRLPWNRYRSVFITPNKILKVSSQFILNKAIRTWLD